MAITRRWQGGFDSNGTQSQREFSGVASFNVSALQAKTGTYSMLVSAGAAASYGYVIVPATRQVRAGFHHWNGGPASAGDAPSMFDIVDAATNELISIRGNDANDLLLYVAGVLQDTALNARIDETWFHVGIDVKIDAAAGWATVYVDGQEILTFAGNTGNADIDEVRFGVTTGAGVTWSGSNYWDDCYIDDTAGQAAAARPPDRRFYPLVPNVDGEYTDWAPFPGAGESHYEDVDERPKDDDTSYVEASAVDMFDSYELTTYVIPADQTMEAFISFAYAKKMDGAVDTHIVLGEQDNATEQYGAEQELPTTYGGATIGLYTWERFTTKAGGGAWDQAGLDDAEVIIESEGTI